MVNTGKTALLPTLLLRLSWKKLFFPEFYAPRSRQPYYPSFVMLEKQEKIKLRLGMFQHIHFQKKPLKDTRNLNVEITNNYWIRLSIKIPSVCIHSKTTQPRPQVFSANCPVFWQLCCRIDVIFHISKTSSNLVNSGWLSWIIRGILANHKRRNTLSE